MSDILQVELKIIVRILKWFNCIWYEICDLIIVQHRLILSCVYVRFGSLITVPKNILRKISPQMMKHYQLKTHHYS